MSLNEYIEEGRKKKLSQEESAAHENKLMELKKKVNNIEFKFYIKVLGISQTEKEYLKKLKKDRPRLFRFINRNVPFGGIRNLIKSKNLEESSNLLDMFIDDVDNRKRFFDLHYGPEIVGVHTAINNMMEEDENQKQMIIKQQAAMKMAQQAELDKEKQEKEEEDATVATDLKNRQDEIESERLYQRQQEDITKQEKKEEIKQQVKEFQKNQRIEKKKDKETMNLVDEYMTMMTRKKELIGAKGTPAEIEREEIESCKSTKLY